MLLPEGSNHKVEHKGAGREARETWSLTEACQQEGKDAESSNGR